MEGRGKLDKLDKGNILWKAELSCATLKIKSTVDGRRPLVEDDLRWKMTFDERRPLMEEDLCWKTTFEE